MERISWYRCGTGVWMDRRIVSLVFVEKSCCVGCDLSHHVRCKLVLVWMTFVPVLWPFPYGDTGLMFGGFAKSCSSPTFLSSTLVMTIAPTPSLSACIGVVPFQSNASSWQVSNADACHLYFVLIRPLTLNHCHIRIRFWRHFQFRRRTWLP